MSRGPGPGVVSGAAVRFVVSGRVQGVFYRASTAEQAGRLGISGWVRNLPDGRVELVATGTPDAIEDLAAWLWTGPADADVTAVSLEDWQGGVEAGFRILR
jgi:acylphosphatase